jgi:hypothetical protein
MQTHRLSSNAKERHAAGESGCSRKKKGQKPSASVDCARRQQDSIATAGGSQEIYNAEKTWVKAGRTHRRTATWWHCRGDAGRHGDIKASTSTVLFCEQEA